LVPTGPAKIEFFLAARGLEKEVPLVSEAAPNEYSKLGENRRPLGGNDDLKIDLGNREPGT
jgi:hypothetical protein